MSTQITHVMHTPKKGYMWRKRYDKNTLEISLQVATEQEAHARGAALTIRFMELELLGVPFAAMRETLKGYKENLIKQDKLNRLKALTSNTASPEALQEAFAPVVMQTPSLAERIEQEAIQRDLATSTGHTLEEAKENYFAASTEWSVKTKKDYSACIDRFIVWCAATGVNTIEAVNKETIVSFKHYMDENELAPNTKQKILTRLGSMFKHAVDVTEWIAKNPITGMMYKKVGVLEKKEEITTAQFSVAIEHNETKNDLQTFWAMQILYHCGLRVSELTQLTKADYVEIEGIKCISINNSEGKSIKNESSIRNIPLSEGLLALGIWEKKPVMKYGDNRTMNAVTQAFKRIGLKRSTHCFRHSLSNRLRDTNADDSTRCFILGHAQANITDRVYIQRLPLLRMKAALDAAN